MGRFGSDLLKWNLRGLAIAQEIDAVKGSSQQEKARVPSFAGELWKKVVAHRALIRYHVHSLRFTAHIER